MKVNFNEVIAKVEALDIRFPTSLDSDGSDAMHTAPDYAVCYVILTTESGRKGYGMTFTLGTGTDIIVKTIDVMRKLIEKQELDEIINNFADFWRKLTSDSQLRWLGPEKGVIHLATAAIVNAIWDLWGRLAKKPVWKLLTDLEPEFLVNLIDFRYCTDVLTKDEAIQLLKHNEAGKDERVAQLLKNGYKAYTTASGWLGYTDDKMIALTEKYMNLGFDSFKIKIGQNLQRDVERAATMRKQIGDDNILMVDANQAFDVPQAIEWMKELKEFKPLWIEEPTSPDDILGHARIADALKDYNIGVATGEMMCNRVMFKQFFQANAFEFCQIDAARIGGVNEVLIVYLMARKFNVKVCPHAGGVGLSEMVQNLQFWDFASVSGSNEGRLIEYVDQQHHHFVNPAIVENGKYIAPLSPGYHTELKQECIDKYQYPNGSEWEKLFAANIFTRP